MSVTEAKSVIDTERPARLPRGSVLVAVELLRTEQPAIRCPAAVLIAGELARLGVSVILGPMHLDPNAVPNHGMLALAGVLTSDGGEVGFGVAAMDDDDVRLAARSALASCLAAAGQRRAVLLSPPRSIRGDLDHLNAIAAQSDVVLVIGARQSLGSIEFPHRHNTNGHFIDKVSDIRPEWLASTDVIALAPAKSAAPGLVEDVIDALRGLGPVTVLARETA
jgi:hypothetical protein